MATHHPNLPNSSSNHHTFTRSLPITIGMRCHPLFASAVARVHALGLPWRYRQNEKVMHANPTVPFSTTIRDGKTRPPPCTSPCIVDDTAELEFQKWGETSKKMYLISFFIVTITNSFSGLSMDILGMPTCLYLAYPPCSKFKVSQHKREMQKLVRTYFILCFYPEIHFNTNHWGHGSLADINWPFSSTLNIEAMAARPTLIGRFCPRRMLTHPPSSLFI
jgi:hypothetical protein